MSEARSRALYEQAMREYRSRCFWNASPSFSEDGLAVVVSRLRRYGDLKAWRLADEIETESRPCS